MRLRSSFPALLFFLFAGFASPLRAQLFWDIDTANKAGASSTAPSGTWSSSKADWNVNADGMGIPRTWIPGETAVFFAGAAVTGPYTVSIIDTLTRTGT